MGADLVYSTVGLVVAERLSRSLYIYTSMILGGERGVDSVII